MAKRLTLLPTAWVFSLMFLLFSRSAFGATVFIENMGSNSANTTVAIASNTFQNSGTLAFSGTADTRGNVTSNTYTGFSGGRNVFLNTGGRTFIISGINTSNYTDLTLKFGHYKEGTGGNYTGLTVEVSTDSISWSALTFAGATGTGSNVWRLTTITGGTIPSSATLFLRFTNSSTVQFRIDDILLEGTLNTSCSAPSTQASAITFSGVASDEMTVGWTNGNGSNRIVKINTTNSFTAPTNGASPTANATYGGSGEQVVYNGNGNSVTVGGLSASTTYHFRVYEYDCSGTLYATSTGTNNPRSQATSAPAPSLSVNPTSHAFGTVANGSTNDFQYTVNASNLTAGVSVSSNNTQYTVSNNSGGPFASTASLPSTGGTVYVRFIPTGGAANATISNTSTTASANFTVSGTGQAPCATPSPATGLTFGTVTTGSIAGSFAGSGASQYLVVRSTTATPPTVANGVVYSASGSYVIVQNTSSTSFSTGGLSPNTPYYFFVYANNTGCFGAPVYATALTGSQSTNALPTTVQFTAASATVTEGTHTSYTLTVSITNPSGTNATTATVSLASGNARVGGFTNQTVTFPAGSSTNQTVVLTVTNNSICDGTANLSFSLGSVSGGTTASVGTQGAFALTVNDDDLTSGTHFGQGFESGGGTSNNWNYSVTGTTTTLAAAARTGSLGRRMGGNNQQTDTYDEVNITGFTNSKISLYLRAVGGLENLADFFEVYVAFDGAAFTTTPEVTVLACTTGSDNSWAYTANGTAIKTVNGSNSTYTSCSSINGTAYIELSLPNGHSSVAIKIRAATNNSSEYWYYDDLTLTADYCAIPVPTIKTDTTGPLAFGNVLIGSNAIKTYTVGGTALTDPIVVTAPTGYQVSKNGVNFFNSISFGPVSGTVADSTVTVRFSPVAATSYNGNITHTSTGAAQVNVSVTGAGVNACTAPLNQATNLILTPAATSINGTFSPASGGADGYLVVRHTSSTLSFGPTDGVSYSAGNLIGGGTVVSTASGNTFSAGSLSTSTTYHFFIYAFNNANCAGGPIYKKPYLAGSATTLASPYVMFDNFDRPNSTTVGIPSSGGTTAWTEVEASVGLAEIYNNRLDINNTSPQGKAYVVFDMNGRYSTTFNQATSELEWYFNMAQTRPDPSGFGTSNYGVAMVLGATSASYSTTGNGYAVVLGESGSNDRVKLVRFTGGLTSGTMTDLVADGPNTNGINGDHLFNIHVKYNPANGTWRLYVNDGGYDPSVTFNFANPTTVTYGSGGTVVDQTYANSNLRYAGALWSYATSAGEFASFDNFNIPTAQPCQNRWTGTTSTDWYNAANWSCNIVPTSTDNVTIPNTSAGSGRYPVIAASLITNASVKDLTIDAGASVTINALMVSGFPQPTNDLEVHGNLTNNGNAAWGTGTVTLKGSAAQTVNGNNNFHYLSIDNASGVGLASGAQKVYGTLALVNGNLATNGRLTIGSNATYTGLIDEFSVGHSGTLTGNITVERYSTNTADNFFYIGAPVGGAQISGWGDDFSLATMNGATDGSQILPTSNCSPSNLQANSPYGGLFDYRENAVNTCNLQGWHVRTTGPAVQGQGFIGRMPAGTTIDLTGTFVTGQTITRTGLTRRSVNNAPTQPGMNLVANPFAAPIDWQAVYAANSASVEGTAHFYQTSGPLAGTYVAVNNTLGGSQIGSSQAFIVQARTNNVNLVFTDGMKRNGANEYLRTAPAYEQLLTLDVTGNGFADRAYVAFGAAFTTGFDTEYDGRKMMSRPNQPSLYVNDGTEQYSIYAQPSVAQVQIVPVDFAAGTNGTFTIAADLTAFDATAMVYLEDRLLGTMTDLRTVGSYSFSATTADAAGRFALHFYPAMSVTTADATCAGADGSIELNQPGTTEWDMELVDANGNTVAANPAFNGSQTVGNLATGTYTLNLAHASGYNVTKTYVVTGPAPVTASFTAPATAVQDDVVTFASTATNATSYAWNFGDGNTSTDASPVHVYANAGTYTVELVATNGNCQTGYTQTITIQEKTGVGIDNVLGQNVRIYAYGTDINIILGNLEHPSTVDVFDLMGRKVIATQQLNQINGTFVIGLESIVNGYYFVRLNNGKDIFTQKVLVNSGK